MSRASALGFVRLVDDAGQEVPDALLELDVDLWNDDHTRYTVFFDPGRVKRGVRPNVELGRALRAGPPLRHRGRRGVARRERPAAEVAVPARVPRRASRSRRRSTPRDWRIEPPGRRHTRSAGGDVPLAAGPRPASARRRRRAARRRGRSRARSRSMPARRRWSFVPRRRGNAARTSSSC